MAKSRSINRYFSFWKRFKMLETTKNKERKPKIANMLEKKTMYGSRVTAKTAGIESTANTMSENSMSNNTKNRGVTNNFPFILVKKS